MYYLYIYVLFEDKVKPIMQLLIINFVILGCNKINEEAITLGTNPKEKKCIEISVHTYFTICTENLTSESWATYGPQ